MTSPTAHPSSGAWDHVIVGAGSAGCVLANRLTADPGVRVLLLEAGSATETPEVSMPSSWLRVRGSSWDWAFSTAANGELDRLTSIPRGRGLGGSSSINAMIYIRGNRADFDGWRDRAGAAGWGWDEVLPYFVRAEANTRLGGPLHGTAGPLRVEDPVYTHETTTAWVESAVASGLAANDDFNGPTQEGVGVYQLTCHRGRRWSTATGYLRPVLDRANLTVVTDAGVHRVLVEGGRARGVRYVADGVESTALVEGEVLVCGGTIGSPQLLMLSGIGPADHLREHGVDVVLDLPGVGGNLHDHATLPVIWTTRGTTDMRDLLADPEVLARWRADGTGPAASNLAEGGGFLATTGSGAPDVQLHVGPSALTDRRDVDLPPSFSVMQTLLQPQSRGRLRLHDADPGSPPDIDLGFFRERADLQTLYRGFQRILTTAQAGPLPGLLDRLAVPEGGDTGFEDFLAYARAYTQTLYHPVGTCAMGAGEDAVVDLQLRVRGIDGLRVVDASVMPTVTRGNTNAPTVMIAERAADLVQGS